MSQRTRSRSAPSRRKNRVFRAIETLEARLVLDSTVVFSELMYHPPDTDGGAAVEWIELHNQLHTDMDLSDWRLEGAVDFAFPDGTIVPGNGYLVVTSDLSAMEVETGYTGAIGPFVGSLSNGGEELRLRNNDARLMNVLDYGDGGKWPVGPDGGGPTLAKRAEHLDSSTGENWTFSEQVGGTPGAANFPAANGMVHRAGNVRNARALVINEVSPEVGAQFVELRNVGKTPLNVGGVVVTVTGPNGGVVTLEDETLAAGSLLVLSSDDLGMTLDNNESVFLYESQDVLLDAQPVTGRLRGRADEFDGQWLYPDVATPGLANHFVFEQDVVINEIMYHAQAQLAAFGLPYADANEEWIEFYNRGTASVDLSGWELRDAVRFEFPSGTILEPDEYLVVANDAGALSQKFPGVRILGDMTGTLSNSDDNILLVDAMANPADAVHYYERGAWAEYADGGGSSLELRDPFADNAQAGAWGASDEGSKSEWRSYSIQKTSNEPLGLGATYNEFIFGMLDAGELLVDDIHVTLDPNSSRTEMIQNSSFEGDVVGRAPRDWRLIGTHTGTVVADPDDANNQILHLIASGPQQHVHDHAETTFIGNAPIRDGRVYEVSFRAKWLGGSRQLNNRLYFTRMSNTFVLDAPQNNGTPGSVNSIREADIGPTYQEFGHSPAVPSAGQSVTVSVRANDPAGVAAMTLWWNRNGGSWSSIAMTSDDGELYTALIPGQSAGQVVQFYVEGVDGAGSRSMYPAAGPDSRALFQVDDGRNTSRPIESLRVILLSADNGRLFSAANRMSNNYEFGTLIRGGEEVFYDVGVRQTGSRYIRPNSGYKVLLNPEHRYLGVHDSIRLDMNGASEILYKQMVNRAGGSQVSMYDDVAHLVTPQHGSSTILLNLARYETIYLEEQFENGSDGTKFELDDITYPTNPSPAPEGLKTGTGVSDQDISYRGDDPEAYRGQLLIKNNRARDDFATMAEFARVINLNGSALDAAIDDVMDVDLWMRHYATQAFLGNWDTYGFRRPKNLRLYIRPADQKVIPLFWDADLANLTEPIIYNGDKTRLDDIRNLPRVSRLFWGHMWDLTNRSFNGDYASYWASHYNALGAGTGGRAGDIQNRANAVRSQALSAIPAIDFGITTNAGNPLTVDNTLVTLAGNGWIDVREIRFAETGQILHATWTDQNSWEVTVPLSLGVNTVTLEAYDFEGNRVAVDTIEVTSTATEPPLRDHLRITEIHYHPQGPLDTEFVELFNSAPAGSTPLDLSGVQFVSGIAFDFTGAEITSLAPGAYVVVVADRAAFETLYGESAPIAGVFTGSLANEGERITLIDAVGATVHDFTYSDGWYPTTDGGGFSLTIVDSVQPISLWGTADGWRPSDRPEGSPGADDGGVVPGAIVFNEIASHASAVTGNWVELYNTTGNDIDIEGWYLSDDLQTPKKYRFPAESVVPARGYFVLDETNTFGSPTNASTLIPFSLPAQGGRLVLRSADEQGEIAGYAKSQRFLAAEPDVTQGLVSTSEGAKFAVLRGDSRGSANQGPVIGPIVINEVMYNSMDGGADFVEIQNISDRSIALNDGSDDAWQFVDGITFSFPLGEMLAPGGYAVLMEGLDDADPIVEAADFRARYDVPSEVRIYVYTPAVNGSLANGGEELTLARPAVSMDGLVKVDELDYDDREPWPTSPDGEGPSLSKIAAALFGNEPASWGAGTVGGTPGRANVLRDETPPTVPRDVTLRVVSAEEVVLAWTPSSDPQSSVDHYVVYRDETPVGTTSVPYFVDRFTLTAAESFQYAVAAVNRDGIAGELSVATSLELETRTFREGVGYNGMIDAEINSGAPTSNNGLVDTSLEVDGDSGGAEKIVLLKWGNLTIPADSIVVDASFTVNVTNAGQSYDVRQMLRPWEEGEVTWNHATAGQPWQIAGAHGPADRGALMATFSGAIGRNTTTLDLAGVAIVQSWVDQPSGNFGMIIADPGSSTDGADFDSREVSVVESRPELSISYVAATGAPRRGDFNLDDRVDARDIGVMCLAMRAATTDAAFDLDGGQDAAGRSDLDSLVTDVMGTYYGDANLDGVVNTADFDAWNLSRFAAGRNWALGDFNCDGVADGRDFNLWNANRFRVASAASQSSGNRPPRQAMATLPTDVAWPAPPMPEHQRAVDKALAEEEADRPTRLGGRPWLSSWPARPRSASNVLRRVASLPTLKHRGTTVGDPIGGEHSSRGAKHDVTEKLDQIVGTLTLEPTIERLR